MDRHIKLKPSGWPQRLWLRPGFRLALAAGLPCLAALLLYFHVAPLSQPFPDSRDYLDLSRNLVDHWQFRSSFDHTPNGEDSLIRTPGYPLLIAAFRPFFGDQAFFPVNLLCLFGTVFFALKLARRLKIRPRVTVLLLFLLSPGLITCTVSALTEVPFAAFLTAGLYLLLLGNPIMAGLSLSLATLIRPAGIYLFVIPALWLLWKQRRLLPVLVFALAANLLPAAWMMRNYVRFGSPVFSTLGGHYLLEYKAGSYLSWRDNVPWPEMVARLNRQIDAKASPIERNRQADALSKKILRANAAGFILWAPRNWIYFLMPDITPLLERTQLTVGNRGTLDILRRQGPIAAIRFYFADHPAAALLTVCYSLFYLLTLALLPPGIFHLWKSGQQTTVVLLLAVIVYLWLIPTGNLDWRFRMPAAPLLFIFIAAGYALLWSVRHKIRSKFRRNDHAQK